jgi:hypothetical protein
MLGAAVHSPVRARRRIDVEAELRRDHHPVAERRESFAHDLFVDIGAIQLRRVEESDAAFDSGADQGNTLILRQCVTAAGADSHAAEANSRYFQASLSKFALFHFADSSSQRIEI